MIRPEGPKGRIIAEGIPKIKFNRGAVTLAITLAILMIIAFADISVGTVIEPESLSHGPAVDVMGILDNTAECFLVSNPATLRLLHELNKQFAMEPEDRTHEDINRLRFLANQLVATSECDLTPNQ